MIDTKIHPADRKPHEGVAYTLEEGGTWIQGPPNPCAAFHSVIFADGWVFDTYLCRKDIDRGARNSVVPVFVNGVSQPIATDVSQFRSSEPAKLATSEWRRTELEKRFLQIDSRLACLERYVQSGAQQYRGIFGP